MKLKKLLFGGTNADSEIQGGKAYRGSVQQWLPLRDIRGGMVVTRDGRFIKILEVLPVNFYLKSPLDQQNIIRAYAAYLKIAPASLQIRVVTRKADIADYIARMRACAEREPNEQCRAMIEDNINEVSDLASHTALTRRFFLIFQHEPQMKAKDDTVAAVAERMNEEAAAARRYLEVCGLTVLEPEYADNAALELLYELFNKRTSRRVKLPSGVFDMLTDVHGIYEK